MSEIYNGTFLLGNTSATTLSAGPGIKIDSTSLPGTIKISNDETVLWSGNDINATVSEPLSSFETVKIYAKWDYNGTFTAFANTEIPGSANSFNLSTMTPSVTTAQSTGAEAFNLVSIYKVQNLSVSAVNKSRININLPTMSCSLYSNTDTLKLQKIVGINRKEV